MKLLLVSDFARHSGFAVVAEAIAAELAARDWRIVVLGVNYKGDPHPLQQRYTLYPAHLGGDMLGVQRINGVVAAEQPDAILIISDPQVVVMHLKQLAKMKQHPPVVAYMPVDAPGTARAYVAGIERLSAAVAYTEFGASELSRMGAPVKAVIPHGIDLDVFYPLLREDARQVAGIDPSWFVVLLLDRNQPRKALDIAVDGFAEWIDRRKADGKPVDHIKLLYHGAVRDAGWDIDIQLDDVGLLDHLVLTSLDMKPLSGVTRDDLRAIYSAADVRLTTTAGEGWGLTLMEAMACGVPVIAPEWAAVAEWAAGCYEPLPIVLTRRHRETLSRAGYTSPAHVAAALEALYRHPAQRAHLAEAGRARVVEPRFQWPAIGAQFDAVLREVRNAA